jgi:hypothetical protein
MPMNNNWFTQKNHTHETAGDKESQATEPTRRSAREPKPIEWLGPKMSGKSCMQQKKKVIYESDVDVQLEYCYNLLKQTKPNESQGKEYSSLDGYRIRIPELSEKERLLLNSIYSTKDLRLFDRRGKNPERRNWINYI